MRQQRDRTPNVHRDEAYARSFVSMVSSLCPHALRRYGHRDVDSDERFVLGIVTKSPRRYAEQKHVLAKFPTNSKSRYERNASRLYRFDTDESVQSIETKRACVSMDLGHRRFTRAEHFVLMDFVCLYQCATVDTTETFRQRSSADSSVRQGLLTGIVSRWHSPTALRTSPSLKHVSCDVGDGSRTAWTGQSVVAFLRTSKSTRNTS